MVHTVPQYTPALSSLAFSPPSSPVYVGGPFWVRLPPQILELKRSRYHFSPPFRVTVLWKVISVRQSQCAMLFGDAVGLHVGWLDYGNVFFSGDWYHLGDDGKGQVERGAKSGLQCNKLFTVVDSRLPIWVYWLPGEIVIEKQICPQMRCYMGGWISSNKD